MADLPSIRALIASGQLTSQSMTWLMSRERVTGLSDLTRFTRAELLAMPGVGEATVDRIEALLAEHGLALKRARRSPPSGPS